MHCLADRGHHVDVQILDNEVSTDFKNTIVGYWCATYQLVPPNVHRRNVVEKYISVHSKHIFSNTTGVYTNFPQVYVGQPLGTDRTDNQPSSASHTQPKHVRMGILQRCL